MNPIETCPVGTLVLSAAMQGRRRFRMRLLSAAHADLLKPLCPREFAFPLFAASPENPTRRGGSAPLTVNNDVS